MKNFLSKKAPKPVGYYPHAKRVGDLLFLSGVGPRVLGSKDIPLMYKIYLIILSNISD